MVIGLTGSFGSGKSTVARMFAGCGADIVDADAIAHEVTAIGTDAYKKLVEFFGRRILDESGRINRRKLGKLVFGDKGKLRFLNRIIHPRVIRIIGERISSSRGAVMVLDVPLLFEAGLDRLCRKTIVVYCDRQVQLRRLARKRRLSMLEINRRIGSQMPLEKKVRLADFVIDNSGSYEKTKMQVGELRRKLWKS